jgi:hypothetical protein
MVSGLVAATLLVGLPLVGVLIKGDPASVYLEFPPLTKHVAHAPFSWIAFCVLAAMILAVLLPFIVRALFFRQTNANQSVVGTEDRNATRTPSSVPLARRSSGAAGACNEDWHSAFPAPSSPCFPRWGWAALLFGVAAWVLAWNRFAWFEPFQRFTFSPLWFAYIAVINALTFRRTGRCLLINRPRYMISLFLVSAAFWWYFEYLNRFVQNWYYENCEGLSPFQYFIFATLPFSTVLPAVMSTGELLASFSGIATRFNDFAPIRPSRPRAAAAVTIAAASAGLALLAVWPSFLFPLLWLSPLLVLTSLDTIAGKPTILDAVRRGNWTHIVTMALAALICGFFWEMWNFWSLANWIYGVPFVQAFHIFEMPILGYAGYLPFGLECAIIAERVAGWNKEIFLKLAALG